MGTIHEAVYMVIQGTLKMADKLKYLEVEHLKSVFTDILEWLLAGLVTQTQKENCQMEI